MDLRDAHPRADAEAGVGLVHRRLSIVDLASGAQPMENGDGSLCVTFNGEIYNHAQLRPQLEARGHVYRTRSDTEVMLQLLAERGEDSTEPPPTRLPLRSISPRSKFEYMVPVIVRIRSATAFSGDIVRSI